MKFIENLCQPAVLYLMYMAVHVGLDLSLGLYITAVVKAVSGIVGSIVLDSFCQVDLGIVSWVVIATPFIITALATSIAMGLNLDKGLQSLAAEHFTSLSSDKYVQKLGGDEAPLSTSSTY
jgi:hypothetical protein